MGYLTKNKMAPALAAAVALSMAGAAQAALQNGFSDASNSTSVFISVVERNTSNQVVRNITIDTGARALETFAGQLWSTTLDQEAQILAFIGSAQLGNTVRFNVGAALNGSTDDLKGFLTSGQPTGVGSLPALNSTITGVNVHIGNANNGTFDASGVLASNGSTDPGWHNTGWGNLANGGLTSSNELLFGVESVLTGWRPGEPFFDEEFEEFVTPIDRFNLGPLTSNLQTGDISFGVVPVPAAAWFIAPAVALLGPWVRRRRQAT